MSRMQGSNTNINFPQQDIKLQGVTRNGRQRYKKQWNRDRWGVIGRIEQGGEAVRSERTRWIVIGAGGSDRKR